MQNMNKCGVNKSIQDNSGWPWRSLESLGEPWRALESPKNQICKDPTQDKNYILHDL